ncbi:MAG: hypothetical protein JXA28_04275 [Bacteroidetes bacterium]|nr:hypothetical protein [Bacteroidota bacterium]
MTFDESTTFDRMQLEASPIASNGSWVNGTWLVQFGDPTNELTSFRAYAKSGSAMLRWITATETNNHGFAVERSTYSRNRDEIRFVAGSGSSSVERRLAYMDAASPAHAVNVHADDLPSGRHFLKLQTGAEQSMYPVVLIK